MRNGFRLLLTSLLLLGVTAAGCSGCEDARESEFFEPEGFGTYEFDADPQISAPERLLFGEAETGDRVRRVALVENTGRENLDIKGWEIVAPDGTYAMSFPDEPGEQPPDVLEPGESVTVAVVFTALSDDAVVGELRIRSNDPDNPTWIIKLYANATFPCLDLSPRPVDFGELRPGESAERTIEASNCSDNALTTFAVDGIEGDQAFSSDVVGQTYELDIGESVELPVSFSPDALGDYQAVMRFDTNVEEMPVERVTLKGRATQGPCPVPVIEAYRPNGSKATAEPEGTLGAVPLETITLTSNNSYDPTDDRRIVQQEWSLVGKPADSGAVLSEASESPDNELWLDLAGQYVVELEVWNNQGMRSCRPARMVIDTVADETFHIQLVWDTPNDPDQTDSSGSDVDLHLLHPNGEWNERPWDCFWQNLEPDWGVPRSANEGHRDDPSLDIDDVDGWGPENINLDLPEPNTRYRVGVHYFSDHGYGVSYATTRIFIDGALQYENRRQRLSDQQFWHVADIDWPEASIIERDTLHQTFPSVP